MIEWALWLEAMPVAQFLKGSRWTYPLVNAGHIFGIALLIGAIIPMNLRLLGIGRGPTAAEAVALLRPGAAAGLALAVFCGALLFVTQASDYVSNGWFQAKMGLVGMGLLSIAIHHRLTRPRAAALISLGVWPAALLAGRMIGYS